MRRCALILFACIAACEPEEERDFGPPGKIDDAIVTQGAWRYRSLSVDVDLEIATSSTATTCATSASLRIDSALDFADRYELRDAACDALLFTSAGDLVVLDQPTGYDWRNEPLRVDTDRETIALGPATFDNMVYELVLSAPECADDPRCDCGRLSRFEDGMEIQLPLGRICD